MFLKRSLVLLTGVLLFIGVYFLTLRLSHARLEDTFRQIRQNYNVDGVVLTAAEPSFTMPAAPSAPASTPAPVASSDTESTPPPGAAPDTNTIIGPVPPSSPFQDSTSPSPAAMPGGDLSTPGAVTQPMSPTPDSGTNSGPIVPSSTYFSPRGARLAGLLFGATETETAPAPAAASAEAAEPVAGAPAHPAPSAGRAIILGYHQFTGPGVASKNIYSMSQDVFASEMKYLHDNGYNVIPLSQVVGFIKHQNTLPQNAVAITIDDGYKSPILWAAPVLKQYGYPWTFFVYPSFITRTEGKGAASWPDLVELQKEGVNIECHSMTHPQLDSHIQKHHTLTPEEYDAFLTNETVTSKAILEHELGKTIKYFAYPYGRYNKAVEAKVIAAGYEAVFTVADNPVHITTNVYRIGRYIITKPVERAFAGYLRQGALSLAQVDPEPGSTTSNPEPVITAVLGFNGDPKTIETEVRDQGIVRHDFDPATSTIRIYLTRPLIQPEVLVSIHAREAQTGQTMVANWTFNYEPAAGAPTPAHQPIAPGTGETGAAPASAAATPALPETPAVSSTKSTP